jgi:hypothetical protein
MSSQRSTYIHKYRNSSRVDSLKMQLRRSLNDVLSGIDRVWMAQEDPSSIHEHVGEDSVVDVFRQE